MIINKDSITAKNIEEEFNNYKKQMYVGKSLEERKELDQFFTPPEIIYKMLAQYKEDTLINQTILDPACGSGNLLVACLIAGADIENLYGNEYDNDMIEPCRKRLIAAYKTYQLGDKDVESIVKKNIHQGNALHDFCLWYFEKDYDKKYFKNKNHKDILESKDSNNNAWNSIIKSDPKLYYEHDKYLKDQENKRIENQNKDEDDLWR